MSTGNEMARETTDWILAFMEAECSLLPECVDWADRSNIANAILNALRQRADEATRAENEACARIAEQQAQEFLSPEYAVGQPLSSFSERFACGQVAAAIRACKGMNEGELVYTEPGELAALRAQNAELVAALLQVRAYAPPELQSRINAALRYAAPPASGEAKPQSSNNRGHDAPPPPPTQAENRRLKEQVAELEAENFALAANQCDEGYGDEYGNHQCRRVDRAVKEAEHLAGEANRWMAENRRLREALKPFANFYERHFKSWQDHESHWTNFDGLTVGDLRRARAALRCAAPPASGEVAMSDGAIYAAKLRSLDPEAYDRLLDEIKASAAPPPPPTQGEEETAREIAVKVIPDTVIYVADLRLKAEPVILAALRQRADEAAEAMRAKCEAIAQDTIPEVSMHDYEDGFAAAAQQIADAIRARQS